MVPPKKKSKRTPVRLRHKIQKRSAEKQRKERKAAKKDPTWKSKHPKDPGIPNSFPYKDKLLAEIEEQRRIKAEEAERKKEERKRRKEEATVAGQDPPAEIEEDELDDVGDDDDMSMDDSENEGGGTSAMAALLASARSRAAEFEMHHRDSEDDDFDAMSEDDTPAFLDSTVYGSETSAQKDTSRKAFDKIFKNVLQSADVILYVLDARDPEGTRSRTVEREVMAQASADKRLILILNKIDLVPPHVLKGWLLYLRRYFPTLPLKATSSSAPGAHTFNHKQLSATGTSTALLKALKSFAAAKQLKRAVTVGVIGYPNVGKSSVINALAARVGGSSNACPTGAEAGMTTSLREIKLDKRLRLLDSPGIVFPSLSDHTAAKRSKNDQTAELILLSALPPKQIVDPIPAVQLLIKRLSQSKALFDTLLKVYNLPPLVTSSSLAELTKDFLVQVARKRGRLGKGGIPNIESAAMAVITDWRDGRIQGWVEPPINSGLNVDVNAKGWKAEAKEEVSEVESRTIVSEWGKEFKLEGLWGDNENDHTVGHGDSMEE